MLRSFSLISAAPIPAELQSLIFERFQRGDRTSSLPAHLEGAGLGLSLAREIARAHGGDLVLVESTQEQTVFCLTLPVTARQIVDQMHRVHT